MDNLSLQSLPSLTEVVRTHQLGANKKLGQHFLLDMNLTDKIARLAKPLEGVNIAEIGPGPGGLTRALLSNNANSVTVIEMDERFLPALADIGKASDNRLSIIKGDALKFDILGYADALILGPDGINVSKGSGRTRLCRTG